ncbi:MAG: hypothetical protein OER04_03190 [Cyclobacteriaceae bacterium]|nr:hypothetical protein [Cyclobacteriaceae bacterium]
MELKDLVVTPLVILFILSVAYLSRERFTNERTKAIFMPALLLKLFGAIMLGVIYQFYYSGGDTYNYFEQSSVVFQAFYESPPDGIKLFLSNGEFHPETFKYAQHIYWYKSPTEYFVIKMAAFFGIFTFNTYSSVAVLFALFSFTGLWAAYTTFTKQFPTLYKPIAWALFFLPSVFFWGSGLMKDTVTLGALGWLFYGFYQGLIEKKKPIASAIAILVSFYFIYQIKIYILLSFLPPAILWVFLENSNRVKNRLAALLLKPLILILGIGFAFLAAVNVTEGDIKYDIDRLGERTKINAEYLYRTSQLQDGSGYYLGELDGSFQSMLRKAPQAINVTLFRPYLWEVANPLMLLSALESLVFTIFFLSLFFKPGIFKSIYLIINKPIISFCFLFTVILAFAVGLNSYNFGTLVRYKIQLLPFYLTGIILIKYYANQETVRAASTSRWLKSQWPKDLSW